MADETSETSSETAEEPVAPQAEPAVPESQDTAEAPAGEDSPTQGDVTGAPETSGNPESPVDDTPEDSEADRVAKAAAEIGDDIKTDDSGRIIGVDGENPVSNVNPDPRTVR